VTPRELIGDEEANVVPCTLIGAARVAETYHHGSPHSVFDRLLTRHLFAWVSAEEVREPKVEDSVLLGLSPSPQQESLRSPLQP
jgi:hypothetical protein